MRCIFDLCLKAPQKCWVIVMLNECNVLFRIWVFDLYSFWLIFYLSQNSFQWVEYIIDIGQNFTSIEWINSFLRVLEFYRYWSEFQMNDVNQFSFACKKIYCDVWWNLIDLLFWFWPYLVSVRNMNGWTWGLFWTILSQITQK